jgi:hypothetical protein
MTRLVTAVTDVPTWREAVCDGMIDGLIDGLTDGSIRVELAVHTVTRAIVSLIGLIVSLIGLITRQMEPIVEGGTWGLDSFENFWLFRFCKIIYISLSTRI